MKALSSLLVLAFWISSWFPTSADTWAIITAVVCILGLLAALLERKPLKDHRWPAEALPVLATLLFLGGAFLAFAASAVGTPVDGVIVLFFVLGFVGYFLMISSIFAPRQTSREFLGTGVVIFCLLATWSWASALAMYFHRGAADGTSVACILVPKPYRYETELSSVWEMRLPEVATSRTGPTGTVILDYHAILVAPSNGRTELYNWSKKRMRFRVSDAKLNRYLPTECP